MQLSPAFQSQFSFHLGCGYAHKKKRKKSLFCEFIDVHTNLHVSPPYICDVQIKHHSVAEFDSTDMFKALYCWTSSAARAYLHFNVSMK